MMDVVQVITTVDDRETALGIGRQLVELGLAACAQVSGPVTSTYLWAGAVETADEWYCVIKTVTGRYPQVEQVIREIHPYDVPEILAVPVVAGSAGYLKWVEESVQGGAQ